MTKHVKYIYTISFLFLIQLLWKIFIKVYSKVKNCKVHEMRLENPFLSLD